jgi:hypothetical protein
MTGSETFSPGDLVEIKSPEEILQTLDMDGALDQLPFMPEMVEFCGRRFRIAKRIVKTCAYQLDSTMRTFQADDVVTLDGLRCSGREHDGCQKACMIFWREAWLRKVDGPATQSRLTTESSVGLRDRLKTMASPNRYYCQASELYRATLPLTKWQRIGKCFSEVRAGNCSAFEMAERIGIWLYWRARRALVGAYAHGSARTTPAESLNLRAGDWVEVKPIASISETLNPTGHNRGLFFSPDMGTLCGGQRKVERKLEKIIVDGSGEMRKLHSTVYLEGSPCGCAHVALGGCPRGELSYWREIWLRRPTASPSEIRVDRTA